MSIEVRDAQLVTVREDTELRAGDDVVILAEPKRNDELLAEFSRPDR